MAISTSSLPVVSFNSVSSSPSSSLPYPSLSSSSARYRGLMVSNRRLHGRLVVNCSSSEMGSSSDSANGRYGTTSAFCSFIYVVSSDEVPVSLSTLERIKVLGVCRNV